jgi:hypothetical protein
VAEQSTCGIKAKGTRQRLCRFVSEELRQRQIAEIGGFGHTLTLPSSPH